MPDPIDPQDLLNRAWATVLGPRLSYSRVEPPEGDALSFAGDVTGPTATDFRRAVSSAYYGLFHAVTLACVSGIVPGAPDEQRYALTRAFAHRDLRGVSGWVSGDKPPAYAESAIGALRDDATVRAVANAIERLGEARLTADYNHSASFEREDVVDLVQTAQQAVDLLESPAFADSPAGRLFLGLVALRARGGGG